MTSLETTRAAWARRTVNGGALPPWPGAESGPLILLGAWRSPRWITYAAKQRFSNWEDLEAGMRIYREAGGDNAVLANVAIDLAETPESANLAQVAPVSLICPPDEARLRLRRVEVLGFDAILLVSQTNSLEEIERACDFL
jgi:hypothetical protein